MEQPERRQNAENGDTPGFPGTALESAAETPGWLPPAFRFRLVGLADMRGEADAVERPAPPAWETPQQTTTQEQIREN